MKADRVESLVSRMVTGAVLISTGLFFLFAGWLFPYLGAPPLREMKQGTLVDPQIALGGAVVLITIGLFLVARAIIGRWRIRDSK
jgi:hypothetical protein